MKKLFSILFILLCASVSLAQTATVPVVKETTQVITPNATGGYNVYNTTNGIQNVTPVQVIKPDATTGGYTVHTTTNGVPNVQPTHRVVPNPLNGGTNITTVTPPTTTTPQPFFTTTRRP